MNLIQDLKNKIIKKLEDIKTYIINKIHLEKYQEWDEKWFYTINHNKYRCSTLNSFMLAMTQIGEAWLPIIAVLILNQYMEFDVNILQKVLWSFAISGLIAQIFKRIFDRIRPCKKLEDAIVVGPDPSGESFPSGHTTSAFAICTIFSLFLPEATLVFMLLALLCGISRIYLGVHWPTDVIAGSIIGIITSLLVFIF